MLSAANNPNDTTAGNRQIPFSRELYIEHGDFLLDPPKKFFRLAPGREVRLRYAYFITCTEVIQNNQGEIVELRCTYDPETKGGNAPDGRKVKGTLHWVSASHAIDAEVRIYDHLFKTGEPSIGDDLATELSPNSLEILENCKMEPCLIDQSLGSAVQFERTGYFCIDKDTVHNRPIFNQTLSLRDSWSKSQMSNNSLS